MRKLQLINIRRHLPGSFSYYFTIFTVFLLLAFALRFFSFFPTVIDHDESTYLVIASELLKGKVLYTDISDMKPVGIFYIASFYIKLFGHSVFGFRMFTAFILALTAFILYRAKLQIGHSRQVAIAAGVIYLIFNSVWTFFGVSPNTEHFFNLFTALAVLSLIYEKGSKNLPLVALLMGIGLLIKVVVVFDFIAFMLFVGILDFIGKKLDFRRFLYYLLTGCLFALPFLLVAAAFKLTGHFEAFYKVNFDAFGNYPQEKDPVIIAFWLLEFFGRFLPISILFFWALLSRNRNANLTIHEKLFVSLWLLGSLTGAVITGRYHAHYLIQLMLPVSFMAANIFQVDFSKPPFLNLLFRKRVGYVILALFILVNQGLQKKDFFDPVDCPREIAAFLKVNIGVGETLYTGNAHQIIYFILNMSPPNRYVHPTLLFAKENSSALGINPEEKLDFIFNKKPTYVLYRPESPSLPPWGHLEQKYVLFSKFEGCQTVVYKINESD